MAHCTTCGTTIADDAAFCPSCGARNAPGAPVQAPPGGAARSGGSKAPLFIGIAVLLVAVLAGGGWFLKGYLDDRATEKRAREQVEVVADFIEGAFLTYDASMVKKSISRDYADRVDELVEGSSDEGSKVSRKWEDGVLVLSVKDDGDSFEITIESDGGDKESADVDLTGDGQAMSCGVELEGSRWIVVDFNGETIAAMFGEDSSSDSGGSSDSEERACFANQRTIEGSVQQYLAADEYNTIDDISGALDEYNYLIGEYIKNTPSCPSDETATYYIYDDGTTDCAAGVHPYYAD